MSTDLQEAINVIRAMIPIIGPEEDYLTIVGAEEQIAATEEKRKKELDDIHANLKALSRVLEAARISSTRPNSVPSAEAHATTLNELDATRLTLAKSISDVEGNIVSKEAELSSLKQDARRLEEFDPAYEHEKELDGTTLRIQMYRGMGFEPIPDKQGKVTKMLVRSQSGDIHRVDFNESESDFEHAELLWKLASS